MAAQWEVTWLPSKGQRSHRVLGAPASSHQVGQDWGAQATCGPPWGGCRGQASSKFVPAPKGVRVNGTLQRSCVGRWVPPAGGGSLGSGNPARETSVPVMAAGGGRMCHSLRLRRARSQPHPQPSARQSHAKCPEPLPTWLWGWHQDQEALPASRSPAVASGQQPPLSGNRGRALPCQSAPGSQPATSLHRVGLPSFPLEGGQAWGRRAGQATPVPGEHSLASSGAVGTRPWLWDPGQHTDHARPKPVAPPGRGSHRAASRDLGQWALGAPSSNNKSYLGGR